MSQVNTTMDAPMSASFKSVPLNPYQERAAAQGRVQAQASDTPQPQPQPSQQPQQPQAPQGSPIWHVPNSVNPAMYQQMEMERNQLIQQQQAMAQQLEEANRTIQNLTQTSQEYEALKQQAQMQAAITDDTFGELSSVDSEDAKRISHATLHAMQQGLSPMKRELEELRKLVDERTAQTQQHLHHERVHALTNKVLAAHPDFLQFQHSPEYQQFMSQRDGLSHMTRDQRAAQEFQAGNTDYVIDVLRQFKEGVPNAANIMSVAPVQTPTGQPAAPQDTPPMTLGELNNLYHMRQISHEDYLQELKKIRSAPQR